MIITVSKVSLFPFPIKTIGVAMLFSSVIVVTTNFPVNLTQVGAAIVLIILGLAILLARQGVKLDLKERKYQQYTSTLVFSVGDWLPLNDFKLVSVLKKNLTQVSNRARTMESVSIQKVGYDICLLNASHRKKLILNRVDSIEDARRTAEYISAQLDFEIVVYNPVISERSRSRR